MEEDNKKAATREEDKPPYERRTPPTDRELQLLTKVYEQVNEEVRYRDKLLHNSYYLVVIVLVLAVGSISSLVTADSIYFSFSMVSGVLLLISGVATFGIGIVILSYNEKRNNASRYRGDLEDEFKPIFESSDVENPFRMNQKVQAGRDLDRSDGYFARVAGTLESVFRTSVSASRISLLFLFFGLLSSLTGLFLLIPHIQTLL